MKDFYLLSLLTSAMTSGIKPAAAWRSRMKAKVFNLAAKVHQLRDVWCSGAMLLFPLFFPGRVQNNVPELEGDEIFTYQAFGCCCCCCAPEQVRVK